jgi:hypothetical protein
MSVSAEKYVLKHKQELIKLYSAFYAGLELDMALNAEIKEPEMQKRACLLATISHKNSDLDLNFSIDQEFDISKYDSLISDELFSVILCEEQVKAGKLVRSGDFYMSATQSDFKSIPKYKKYIRIK